MSPRRSAGIERPEFAGQLFFRLWRASHTSTAAALASVGVTPALFAVLNHLRDHDGAIQQQIGSAMGIDPSTMVSLVDELERLGLARRRPHPEDRRARAIAMTPSGRRTLERARALAASVEDDVLRGLSASERGDLLALLRKAIAAAPAQPPWNAEEDLVRPEGGKLDRLRNVGPATARRLEAVGVRDLDDLTRIGAAAAFVAVRGRHPQGTSLNLLWALDGALRDRDWRDLTERDKHRLLDEVDALDAAEPAA